MTEHEQTEHFLLTFTDFFLSADEIDAAVKRVTHSGHSNFNKRIFLLTFFFFKCFITSVDIYLYKIQIHKCVSFKHGNHFGFV